MSLGESAKNGGNKVARIRPSQVLTIGAAAVGVLAAASFSRIPFLETPSGFLLLAIAFVGVFIALAAPNATADDRKLTWSELGIGLLVAGLLSFAVWGVAEMRRPLEQREALQAMLGFKRDMPGIDLHGKHLERFDLSGKNLEGANLAGAQLDDATLVDANLSGADLTDADLSETNLEAADLSNADLSGADLDDALASRADLHEARLLEADLSRAELSRANLRGMCLTNGSLVEASLPWAHLERAALTGTDLEGAEFWVDLRGAFLATIGLDGAENTKTAAWPPGFGKRAEELTVPDRIRAPRIATRPRGSTGAGRVIGVPDGDTVLLWTLAGNRRMRPIGVAAPELDEAGGGSARATLHTLLPPNSWVHFSRDRRRKDESGRELVYLFGPGKRLVNQQLLQRGAAVVSIDPRDRREGLRNIRYAGRLAAAEAWARQHALGLWETCPP